MGLLIALIKARIRHLQFKNFPASGGDPPVHSQPKGAQFRHSKNQFLAQKLASFLRTPFCEQQLVPRFVNRGSTGSRQPSFPHSTAIYASLWLPSTVARARGPPHAHVCRFWVGEGGEWASPSREHQKQCLRERVEVEPWASPQCPRKINHDLSGPLITCIVTPSAPATWPGPGGVIPTEFRHRNSHQRVL
jgi:hypothetical protein